MRSAILIKLAGVMIGAFSALAIWVYLYTLPGVRRLPKQKRTTVEGVATIEDAIQACKESGLQGWDLVAHAQNIAARKFSYSRRNPWDTPTRAFARGLGYCQQQALALKKIYDELGIEAQPVYVVKGWFPPGVVHGVREPARSSGHVWLQVRIGNEVRDVCPGRVENQPGKVHFKILSPVRSLRWWLQPVTHLGSVIENARRDRLSGALNAEIHP